MAYYILNPGSGSSSKTKAFGLRKTHFGVATSWTRDALDQFAYNTKRETPKRPTIVQRFAVKVSRVCGLIAAFVLIVD